MEHQRSSQHANNIHRQHDDWDEVHHQLMAIQKKSLQVSNPGDADEQEADTVARKVMSGESVQIHGTGSTINRKGEGAFETTPEFQTRLESSKGSGQSLDKVMRKEMESKMGADFSHVKIHTGGEAHAMNVGVNAKAFAHGNDIYFKQGEYNPQTGGGKELLAHELAHTVQQRNNGKRIHRYTAVNTFGGSFIANQYVKSETTDPASGHDLVGADFILKFTPSSLLTPTTAGVTENKVAMVQTVKTLQNTSAGGAVNTPGYTSANNKGTNNAKLSGETGTVGVDPNTRTYTGNPIANNETVKDRGNAIDKLDYVNGIPQTNPLYLANGSDVVSASLGDIPANNYGTYGSVTASGTITAALMGDAPRREIQPAFPNVKYAQSFEVAAIVVEGDKKNTYLGSINWGWKSTGKTVTLDPADIKLASAGAPTENFMAAAGRWNSIAPKDQNAPNTTRATVDLPISALKPTTKSPEAMATIDIIKRLQAIDATYNAMADSPDKNIILLEYQSLTAVAKTRTMNVNVKVNTQEDFITDNVYIKAKHGTKEVRSPGGDKYKNIEEGKNKDFAVSLGSLWPDQGCIGPITIRVYDYDSPDADDLMVSVVWMTPFLQNATNKTTQHGADYLVTMSFP